MGGPSTGGSDASRVSTWCMRTGARSRMVSLTREWTRIGRSLAADVRFDDPTVSRRHALVVRQADGVRVLDDRSLNGVFVNGERVEWRALHDGDEILVGRYCLTFVSVEAAAEQPLGRAGPHTWLSAPRRIPRTIGRHGPDDRCALAEGRYRQDHGGAHAHRRAASDRRAARWRWISTRRATCPTISTCRPTASRRSPTCSPGAATASAAIHEDVIPASLNLAETELMLGGKIGREMTLRRALAKVQGRV